MYDDDDEEEEEEEEKEEEESMCSTQMIFIRVRSYVCIAYGEKNISFRMNTKYTHNCVEMSIGREGRLR